jgi:hypothetical protein
MKSSCIGSIGAEAKRGEDVDLRDSLILSRIRVEAISTEINRFLNPTSWPDKRVAIIANTEKCRIMGILVNIMNPGRNGGWTGDIAKWQRT